MDEAGVSLSQEKLKVAGVDDLPPTQQEEEILPPTQQEESANIRRDHTQVTAAPSAADVQELLLRQYAVSKGKFMYPVMLLTAVDTGTTTPVFVFVED